MTNLTPEQRALGRENANRALGVDPPRLPQGRRRRARPGRVLLRLREAGQASGPRRHHRHRQRGLPGDDPRPQPRLHRTSSASATSGRRSRSGPSRSSRHTSSTARPTPRSSGSTTTTRRCSPTPTSRWSSSRCRSGCTRPIAIEAMKAGKHVFCEKLMAHSVRECKEMCRVARETNKLLAIGHQRHYSVLYDNANYLVQNGHLGEIRHIRALWHRNNAQPRIAKDKDGKPVYDPQTGDPSTSRTRRGTSSTSTAGSPPSPSWTRRSTSPSTATRASTSWSAGGSTTAPAPA